MHGRVTDIVFAGAQMGRVDDELLALYRQVFDYTFRTFPNPDREIGEWIQIRDRQGRPEQRVVALPVKDPFHIIRNVAQIIELLAIAPRV